MHETSIVRQLRRDTSAPPYCPRKECPNHKPEYARPSFFRFDGRVRIKRFPYYSQCFRCKDCNRRFSASFFTLAYRNKTWGLDEVIHREYIHGLSKRAIGRILKVSEHLVRDRITKMARWGMLFHAKAVEGLSIQEDIAYDGLENFSFSQYDPNNINHAVGKQSLFIYDFNFAPLNRKGRMTPYQQTKKKRLEKVHGHYPKNAIQVTTERVFRRLYKMTRKNLTLYTDNHYVYRDVVEKTLKGFNITHIKTSSKIHRNYQNPLFAVNNIDLQCRQNLAAFRRETIAFAKHEIAMQDCFSVYQNYRNYMRPKFWGTHRSDPESSKKSPAMEIGLLDKILHFKEFFAERILPTHVKLSEDTKDLYQRRAQYSRRTIATATAF